VFFNGLLFNIPERLSPSQVSDPVFFNGLLFRELDERFPHPSLRPRVFQRVVVLCHSEKAACIWSQTPCFSTGYCSKTVLKSGDTVSDPVFFNGLLFLYYLKQPINSQLRLMKTMKKWQKTNGYLAFAASNWLFGSGLFMTERP
jgi:hypothetical protein